jgi:hypothetical protein
MNQWQTGSPLADRGTVTVVLRNSADAPLEGDLHKLRQSLDVCLAGQSGAKGERLEAEPHGSSAISGDTFFDLSYTFEAPDEK